MDNIMTAYLKPPTYIRHDPYVGDDGIYVPVEAYLLEGYSPAYRRLIFKELFIEAYEKWILNKE